MPCSGPFGFRWVRLIPQGSWPERPSAGRILPPPPDRDCVRRTSRSGFLRVVLAHTRPPSARKPRRKVTALRHRVEGSAFGVNTFEWRSAPSTVKFIRNPLNV
jgi:hypothetical protein